MSKNLSGSSEDLQSTSSSVGSDAAEIVEQIERELCEDTDFESDSCGEGEVELQNKDMLSETISVTSNSLLRATICELERALKDTRRLLFERDKENSTLRHELARARKELDKEVEQRQKMEEGRNEQLEQLTKDHEKTKSELLSKITELNDQVEKCEKSHEKSDETTDDIIPCCSSMNELVEVKRKLKETEARFEEFRVNNAAPRGEGQVVALRPSNGVVARCSRHPAQKELELQLRMKFLRDAFFYYMIDFHSDEQIKAILAILAYEDKRADIIVESHGMRQRGKKFKVSEVSSRSLTFVQERR